MKFGYARVSKSEQNLDMQLDGLRKYGVDEIYQEKVSSRSKNRPELVELLKKLRSGDTLVIWKLDRLGRTVRQLIQLAEDFEKIGINFVSLHEQLDTTTAVGKFVFHMFCAVAQMERDVISERTLSGLEAARQRGRKGGRKSVDEKALEQAIRMYNTGEFFVREIVAATGIAKPTLYKYLNLRENTSSSKEKRIKEAILLYKTGKFSVKEVVERYNLSKPTFYKYLKKEEENEGEVKGDGQE